MIRRKISNFALFCSLSSDGMASIVHSSASQSPPFSEEEDDRRAAVPPFSQDGEERRVAVLGAPLATTATAGHHGPRTSPDGGGGMGEGGVESDQRLSVS